MHNWTFVRCLLYFLRQSGISCINKHNMISVSGITLLGVFFYPSLAKCFCTLHILATIYPKKVDKNIALAPLAYYVYKVPNNKNHLETALHLLQKQHCASCRNSTAPPKKTSYLQPWHSMLLCNYNKYYIKEHNWTIGHSFQVWRLSWWQFIKLEKKIFQ